MNFVPLSVTLTIRINIVGFLVMTAFILTDVSFCDEAGRYSSFGIHISYLFEPPLPPPTHNNGTSGCNLKIP